MAVDSIFPVFSMDRSVVTWEYYLLKSTPFEQRGDVWFKREDHFAPLGYGGINGSKLRQCIYLLNKNSQKVGVISGSSVKSPQISMSTMVAKHYGMESLQVIGATKPETALQHENVAIAASLGAKFVINKVAYNPALQRTTKKLAEEKPDWYRLEYGISLPNDCYNYDLETFHAQGAYQVKGFPPHIENLIIPVGSANSAISILYGLYLHQPTSLRNIYFCLIGPNKLDFLFSRLERVSKYACEWISQNYVPHILDIHGEKWATYQDEVHSEYEGIEFHPTYEGKCWEYIKEKYPSLLHDATCFWIVGSKPYKDKMSQFLGPTPDLLPLA